LAFFCLPCWAFDPSACAGGKGGGGEEASPAGFLISGGTSNSSVVGFHRLLLDIGKVDHVVHDHVVVDCDVPQRTGFLQNGFIAMFIAHDVPREVRRHEGLGRNHLPVIVRDRFDLDVDADILIVCRRERRPS
jgi:hypothetical protein